MRNICCFLLVLFHGSFNDALWRICKLSKRNIKLCQSGSSSELYIPNRNSSGSWDNYKLPTSATNSFRNTLLTSSVSISAAFPAYAASIAEIGSQKTIASASTIQDDRFAYLGGGKTKSEFEPLKISRIINGMWQVSGAHGYSPVAADAIEKMSYFANEGFTTFDLADIYGPAEDYVGAFRRGRLASSISQQCQYLTKWVPRPADINRRIASEAIGRSLDRMKTDRLDLLQFHWWDYSNLNYYIAVDELMHLQQDHKILQLGLTNFDSKHMVDLIEQGAPIVSNQVSFSVLDTRPLQRMVPACQQHGVQLLCYGTLLGGFLSDYWLGKPDPSVNSPSNNSGSIALNNVSLRKYLPWIGRWGGWELFQELLRALRTVAIKHGVSISNVALRWVLDQQAVGGVIVGIRLGLTEHLQDNQRVYSLRLDAEDLETIAAVQRKGRDLMQILGDCGDEYRRRT